MCRCNVDQSESLWMLGSKTNVTLQSGFNALACSRWLRSLGSVLCANPLISASDADDWFSFSNSARSLTWSWIASRTNAWSNSISSTQVVGTPCFVNQLLDRFAWSVNDRSRFAERRAEGHQQRFEGLCPANTRWSHPGDPEVNRQCLERYSRSSVTFSLHRTRRLRAAMRG